MAGEQSEGSSWGGWEGVSVRYTSTSSGTSSRKLEGTRARWPFISPCRATHGSAGVASGGGASGASSKKEKPPQKHVASGGGASSQEEEPPHKQATNQQKSASCKLSLFTLVHSNHVRNAFTHVVEPIFINISKHSDDVTSAEGQLSLSDTQNDLHLTFTPGPHLPLLLPPRPRWESSPWGRSRTEPPSSWTSDPSAHLCASALERTNHSAGLGPSTHQSIHPCIHPPLPPSLHPPIKAVQCAQYRFCPLGC